MIWVQRIESRSGEAMPIGDYTLPPVKRQILIRKGLGRWLSVIDLLLERFAGIEQIIECIEEDDPMAVMVTIINAVCAESGAELVNIQVLLGHVNLATRQIYTHMSEDRMAGMVARL
jgi:hypothetical protein